MCSLLWRRSCLNKKKRNFTEKNLVFFLIFETFWLYRNYQIIIKQVQIQIHWEKKNHSLTYESWLFIQTTKKV